MRAGGDLIAPAALVALAVLAACAQPGPPAGERDGAARAFAQSYGQRRPAPRERTPARPIAGALAPLRKELEGRFGDAAARRALVPIRASSLEGLRALAADDKALARRLLEPLPFVELAALVWLRHPAIEAARHDLRAVFEQLDQAGFLAEIAGQYRTFTRLLDTRVGPARNKQRTERLQPYPAALALRGEWVAAEAEMAFERLRRSLREALAEAYRAAAAQRFAHARVDIARGQIRILVELDPVVRTNVAANLGSLADLLAVRAEIQRQRADLATLLDREGEERERLVSLLHLPAGSALAAEAVVQLPGPPALPPERSSWNVLAGRERQELREQRAGLRRIAAAIRLSELLVIPRPATGSALMQRGLQGEAGAVRGELFGQRPRLPQPAWYGTRAALLRELREREQRARARLADLEDQVALDVEGAAVAAASAVRDLRLYEEELVPLAEQALQVVQAAYDGNRARFPDVLAAARRVLTARLGRARARRAVVEARARTLQALGVEL